MAPYDAAVEQETKPNRALKLSPEEIVSAVEAEEAFCIGGTELQSERTAAIERYRGLPLGNEVDGRSQVVDKSILDTIEWIMPSLIRIYLGGDGIGQFEARGPEDEEAAKRETDVCNWYLETKNDLFSQINSTLRDALLLKNGYMVGYWSKNYDTMTESYEGMSDEEAAMLMQDAEVTVLEHSERPDEIGQALMQAMATHAAQNPQAPPQQQPMPMLHDIKVERKTCDEFVKVESVPPDELFVSRRHRCTSLMDCDFVQWRRRVTIGQLRAEGFKVDDDEPQDEEFLQESVVRERYNRGITDHDDTPDPARRIVTFKDTYMRIDLRGKGTTQLWRIAIIDGKTVPTLCEEADIVVFAAFSPIIYPHSHVGSSVFDLVDDLGLIKTTLLRQFLDGVYLANSGRVAVDADRVSIDDLLISRPGGVVRVEGDPGTAIIPIPSNDVTQSVLGGLQYIDEIKEQRTGVARNTQGLDPNTLNRTATGVQMVQSAANQRIELIARTLASGFRDLYVIVHALALKHSTKPLQIKLAGQWVPVNPREWTRRTDFAISVGLGVGTPDAQLAKLAGMVPAMERAAQMQLAGPTEIYNFIAEGWKAAGWKHPDKFLQPPKKDPQTGQVQMPPPPPDPHVQVEQIRQQGAQAKAQMDMQMHGQQLQMDAQTKQQQLQMEMTQKQQQAANELEVQKSNDERQSQLDQQKHMLEMARIQAEMESKERVEIRKAEIQMASAIEVARINAGLDDGLKAAQEAMDSAGLNAQAIVNSIGQAVQGLGEVFANHTAAMDAHSKAVSAPKTIVRHPVTGRAIGIAPGNPSGTTH